MKSVLKGWDRNSAAGVMTNKVPILTASSTLADARIFIEENIRKLDSFDYFYILDNNKKLIGVFSVKSLYNLKSSTIVYDVCNKDIISIRLDEDKEKAAFLALKYNISAIPVVDEKNRFVGVIAKDKIFSILHKKHFNDLFKFAGIHRSHLHFDNVFEVSIFDSIRYRILWLVIGLIGGIFAARIIGAFENTLEQNIILAAFIPLVVYIADAVGTQLEAFIIRDFAVSKDLNFPRYFLKQLFIITALAFLLGIISVLISSFIFPFSIFSLVLGVAVFFATISSIISGLLIPFILRKFKFDPAYGSGPISTIIQDIFSVTIYFLVAGWLL